ncbi:MAG: OPT family oligopeptide transporter [Planctomycetota bacterium]|jgi:OPT family oligopeptide transporter
MNEQKRFLPEITVKAVVLGVVLSVVLAGANAYLGLFAGMTISASIPAAVVSMGVLRLFRRSNILENNIVQTAASAGESLAAGVIFTLPALIILDYWTKFDFLWVTIIAGFGGLLGVLFTIPLRRALIVEMKLKFPEGIATAEVLKSGPANLGGGNRNRQKRRRLNSILRLESEPGAAFGRLHRRPEYCCPRFPGWGVELVCGCADYSQSIRMAGLHKKRSWKRTMPQSRPSWANRLKQRNTRGGYGRSERDTSASGGCSLEGYGPSSSCERLFSAASEAG